MPSRTRRGGIQLRPPVGRNSSMGNRCAIRFHSSSGIRHTVAGRCCRRVRFAAIPTSVPSPLRRASVVYYTASQEPTVEPLVG